MSGFAVIYREASEHPLFAGDSARLGAWTYLILKACWKPTRFNIGGSMTTIERGQICASRAQLAAAWGWKPSAVERFLARLETEQMIGREAGQGRTVITICNYDKYQDVGEETGQATGQASGQPSDSHRTTKEPLNQETSLEEEAYASPSSAGVGEELPLGDQPVEIDPPAKPKRQPKAKRPTADEIPLPADWEPVLTPAAQRIVDGWPPGAFERERMAFESHAANHDRHAKDWQAAFRTWIAKAEERRTQNGNRSAPNRSGTAQPQGRGGGQPVAAGFQRRAFEAQSRRVAEEADRRDAGQIGGDDFLPLAPARPLPRA